MMIEETSYGALGGLVLVLYCIFMLLVECSKLLLTVSVLKALRQAHSTSLELNMACLKLTKHLEP